MTLPPDTALCALHPGKRFGAPCSRCRLATCVMCATGLCPTCQASPPGSEDVDAREHLGQLHRLLVAAVAVPMLLYGLARLIP